MLTDPPAELNVDIAVVPIGDAAALRGQGMIAALRRAGLSAELLARGNMKKRMQKADTLGVEYALIFGDEELDKDHVNVKRLATGEQGAMPMTWVPQGVFDLIFEDGASRHQGEPIRPLASRLPELVSDPVA